MPSFALARCHGPHLIAASPGAFVGNWRLRYALGRGSDEACAGAADTKRSPLFSTQTAEGSLEIRGFDRVACEKIEEREGCDRGLQSFDTEVCSARNLMLLNSALSLVVRKNVYAPNSNLR
jgi:hypothetical protein